MSKTDELSTILSSHNRFMEAALKYLKDSNIAARDYDLSCKDLALSEKKHDMNHELRVALNSNHSDAHEPSIKIPDSSECTMDLKCLASDSTFITPLHFNSIFKKTGGYTKDKWIPVTCAAHVNYHATPSIALGTVLYLPPDTTCRPVV